MGNDAAAAGWLSTVWPRPRHRRAVIVSFVVACALLQSSLTGQSPVDRRHETAWPLWLGDDALPALPPDTAPNLDVAFGARKPSPAATTTIREDERWTRLALDLIVRQRLNPLRAARVLAILHVAMHDALVRGLTQADDERIAWIAVHRAASLVLSDLFPEESADRLEALGLAAAAGLGASAPDKGVALWTLGGDVARRAAARARRDGSDRVWALDRRPPPAPGRWQPTPPINSANPLEPLGGEWRPWVLTDGAAVSPPDPVPYDSTRFHEEVDEVRRVASSLTPAQKKIAEKWNLDRGTITPAGVWNLMALDLAREARLDTPTTVRMLAAMNVATMDAFIACWHAKYKWWTVRPITIIRERHDPAFLSHLLTPPFPSYVSGHASASGAASAVLTRFFPDRAGRLTAEAEEAAESRLLGGIHYRSDNEEGLKLGREVGRRVLTRVFR
jgi:hypothetical protein